MQFSKIRSDERARTIAERLAGEKVVALEQLPGVGNNRLYHVRTGRRSYALKSYGTSPHSLLRLQREHGGLAFLSEHGSRDLTPKTIAADMDAGFALYEWIEGSPLHTHFPADIDAVVMLLTRTHAARNAEGAAQLPLAAEACLSGASLLGQIERRLSRLRSNIAPEEAAFGFVDAMLGPSCSEYAAALEARSGTKLKRDLDPRERTLSPSDLSFHNAVRRTDGTLAFLDFEYFGWDDPVKLVSDFLWHPAMQLSLPNARRFVAGVRIVYGARDADFETRLRAYFPIYGLRWCLIILNEFLAEHWERRRFSGDRRPWDDVKATQLKKAELLLTQITAGTRAATLC